MKRRRLWLRLSLYVVIAGFAISILTSGLLGAAVKEWIFLSPFVGLMVRVLVVVASLCLVTGAALFVRALLIKEP
jgi:hypothetical protein